ncbi:SRPBCC domain-containing protein [Actinomycetes bacterium NPDC127524]
MTKNIEIIRTFNVPRDLVFKAFTEAGHLVQWWGPKGWKLEITKSEFKAGGVFHYSQTSSEGHKMWGKFVYKEISAPDKLVYTNSFSDEDGNTLRAPFNANWPLEILNTLTFTESESGETTTLTMIGEPVTPTEEEIKTFEASKGMVQQGFSGTFHQLTEYLSKI